jgi:hypothetical protein
LQEPIAAGLPISSVFEELRLPDVSTLSHLFAVRTTGEPA